MVGSNAFTVHVYVYRYQQVQVREMFLAANLNASLCYLKLHEPDKAIKFATKVLRCEQLVVQPISLSIFFFVPLSRSLFSYLILQLI